MSEEFFFLQIFKKNYIKKKKKNADADARPLLIIEGKKKLRLHEKTNHQRKFYKK
jgi:hypothetical protein